MSSHSSHGQSREGERSRTGPLLLLFGLVIVYAVIALGMPVAQAQVQDRQRRDIFLVVVGVLGLAGGLVWGREKTERNREAWLLTWATVGLPVWALVQIIPLPVGLVNLLSPARGELLRGLAPVFGTEWGRAGFASLSIVPAVTLNHFLLLSSYAVLLLAARELALRARRKTWMVAGPVLVAGAVEAALALLQFTAPGEAQVRGTYVVRNHLAGLLEMAMPLAAMYGVARIRMAQNGGREAKQELLKGVAGLGLAALLLTAGVLSLSRGGLMGFLGAALAMAVMSVGREVPLRQRVVAGLVLGAVIFGALLVLTPDSLVDRFATHSSEGRTALWREGIGVVRDYPLTGAGMGGFQTAFLKYKALEGQFVVDYAHNDYLQGLAELGVIGFLMPVLMVGLVVKRSVRIAAQASEMRWVAVGCLGSVVALLIHSAVDFNLYTPANAAVFAWVCGLAAGVTPLAPKIVRRSGRSEGHDSREPE